MVEASHSLADHGNQDNRQTLQEQSQRMPQREHVTGFVSQRRHATHRWLGREFSGFDVNCEREKRDGWGVRVGSSSSHNSFLKIHYGIKRGKL